MSAFGLALAKLREARGWSQAELAKRANTRQGTISNIELGRRMPGSRLLYALTSALGVTPNELYEAAGMLNEPDEVKTTVEILRQLGPEERQRVDEYARWRLKEQKGRYRTGGGS